MFMFLLWLIGGCLVLGIGLGVFLGGVCLLSRGYNMDEYFVRCSRCGRCITMGKARTLGMERFPCECGYWEQVPPLEGEDT